MSSKLSSNNGEDELTIKLLGPAEYACNPGFESSILFKGMHWDGDHKFPMDASIDGVWLSSKDLLELRNHIRSWTNQPMDQLTPDDLNRDFRLARLPGQTLNISFGPRADTISNLNPVVSIAFSAGYLHCKFHFVTDQSCLAIFANELSAQIDELQNSAR